MSNLFSAFDKVSKEEWKAQIIEDLKGKEHAILQFHDPIEEIDFDAYYHNSDIKSKDEKPGNYPYKRGLNTSNNDWSNVQLVEISDAKEANKVAITLLMSGANALIFDPKQEVTDWETVLSGIQTEHINIQFNVTTYDEYQQVMAIVGQTHLHQVYFNVDLLADINALESFSQPLKSAQHPVFVVKANNVHESGATSWQEIGFALNAGHEYLVKLMESGLSIDEAAACIHFHLGVGSNYFFEIAKLRSFRSLWAKLINAYNPDHSCSHNTSITVITSMMNKSLADPYTNLLRQTTESMSAISGGADHLLVLPYDTYATNKSSNIARRMATNISLILAEESYFDIVTDPTGGSYSVEVLTDKIGSKAWSLFQRLEKEGGLFSLICQANFAKEIKTKRDQRIAAFNAGDIVQIGTNKHPSPEPSENSWISREDYLGLAPLVYECESKIEFYEKS